MGRRREICETLRIIRCAPAILLKEESTIRVLCNKSVGGIVQMLTFLSPIVDCEHATDLDEVNEGGFFAANRVSIRVYVCGHFIQVI